MSLTHLHSFRTSCSCNLSKLARSVVISTASRSKTLFTQPVARKESKPFSLSAGSLAGIICQRQLLLQQRQCQPFVRGMADQQSRQMNTVEKVCAQWTKTMEEKGVREASVGVGYIVAHVLGRKTMHGISGWQELSQQQMEEVNAMCQQRLTHKPVQYILGTWDFCDIEVKVKPPVFIPRPETEGLVALAIQMVESKNLHTGRFLDFCCGSGAISLSLLHKFPQAHAVAVDISPEACGLSEENAQRLGLSDRITVVQGDLTDSAVQERLKAAAPFDLLVSNPPYVRTHEMPSMDPDIVLYEDLRAMNGGEEGVDIHTDILLQAPDLLHADSDIVLEIQSGQPKLIEDRVKAMSPRRLQFLATHLDHHHKERFCHLRTVDSQQSEQH